MQKAEILILDFPLISCLSYNHGSYAFVLLCATPSSHDSIWGIISRWDRDRSIHGNWLHSISSIHFHKSLWGILKTKDTLRLFIWPVTTASWCYVKTIAHWWIWLAMDLILDRFIHLGLPMFGCCVQFHRWFISKALLLRDPMRVCTLCHTPDVKMHQG